MCYKQHIGSLLKVTDFDVAVRAQDEPVPCSMTVPRFAHLAPEVITDQMVSKASDVYAFGILLWELIMGEPAWNGLSYKDIAVNVVSKKMQLAFPDYEPIPYKVSTLQCYKLLCMLRTFQPQLAVCIMTTPFVSPR